MVISGHDQTFNFDPGRCNSNLAGLDPELKDENFIFEPGGSVSNLGHFKPKRAKPNTSRPNWEEIAQDEVQYSWEISGSIALGLAPTLATTVSLGLVGYFKLWVIVENMGMWISHCASRRVVS